MLKACGASTTPWAFRARFRRAAFGWNGSKLAIERIHEALAAPSRGTTPNLHPTSCWAT
ncbi:MAG: hypothetical protein WCA12_16980 [Burkholderiales bacterium]